MEIQGYFTQKGLALSAKLLTGATLTITRVAAGGGNTGNPLTATALPQLKQTLAVNTPTRSGNTAIIPATLTASLAEAAYKLTELGVYARDPQDGEILYKIYKLTEPVDISPDSRLVLRFYLEETVSQDLDVTVTCSPAGLITETELEPVLKKVMGTVSKPREISMAANELQAFLDALPCMLTEHLTITVSGTLDTALYIRSFYGSGSLSIIADSTAGCTFLCPVSISDCRLSVQIWNIRMEAQNGLSDETALCTVTRSNCVRLVGCTLVGNQDIGESYGVDASYASGLICEECETSGLHEAVFAGRMSTVLVFNSTAGKHTGNTYGAHVWRGGTIILAGNVPDTLGGSANLKDGGAIFKVDGTLL